MDRGREVVRELARRTDRAIRRRRQWLVRDEVPSPEGFELLFLGTGGNPTNVVGQWRRTGGFVLTLPGARIFVDPGPGAVYHARKAHCDLRALTAVFISHAHTDHASGAAPVVEAMCRGMTQRRGALLGPKGVLEGLPAFYRGEAPSRWYPGGPRTVRTLVPGDRTVLEGGVTLLATPAHHAEENIGFRITHSDGPSVGYTSDTAFVETYTTDDGIFEVQPGEALPEGTQEIVSVADDVVDAMSGVDLLVMNVSFFNQNPHRHLTVLGATELCRRARPGRAVLTHFDPSLGTPGKLADQAAAYVQEMSGIPTLAARDGLALDVRRADGG